MTSGPRRRRRDPLVSRLPWWVRAEAPDPGEADAAVYRRRWVVAAASVAGARLLRMSLSTKPGSARFYILTVSTAATWTAGGLGSGPLHWTAGRTRTPRRPVITPVLIVTLMNAAAEEIFFRGALYTAVGRRHPVALSTTCYSLATAATRNPALILASAATGALFGLQRRATGGIQASMLTHLTWSTLMLRFLPPLFRPDPARPPPAPAGAARPRSPASWSRRVSTITTAMSCGGGIALLRRRPAPIACSVIDEPWCLLAALRGALHVAAPSAGRGAAGLLTPPMLVFQCVRVVVSCLTWSTPSMNSGNDSNWVHWLYAVLTGTATSIDCSMVFIRHSTAGRSAK